MLEINVNGCESKRIPNWVNLQLLVESLLGRYIRFTKINKVAGENMVDYGSFGSYEVQFTDEEKSSNKCLITFTRNENGGTNV